MIGLENNNNKNKNNMYDIMRNREHLNNTFDGYQGSHTAFTTFANCAYTNRWHHDQYHLHTQPQCVLLSTTITESTGWGTYSTTASTFPPSSSFLSSPAATTTTTTMVHLPPPSRHPQPYCHYHYHQQYLLLFITDIMIIILYLQSTILLHTTAIPFTALYY